MTFVVLHSIFFMLQFSGFFCNDVTRTIFHEDKLLLMNVILFVAKWFGTWKTFSESKKVTFYFNACLLTIQKPLFLCGGMKIHENYLRNICSLSQKRRKCFSNSGDLLQFYAIMKIAINSIFVSKILFRYQSTKLKYWLNSSIPWKIHDEAVFNSNHMRAAPNIHKNIPQN